MSSLPFCFGLALQAACVGIGSPLASADSKVTTVVVCPPVRTWTKELQRQVAAEMRLSPNSALAQVAVQAIGDRDIVRACVAQNRQKVK